MYKSRPLNVQFAKSLLRRFYSPLPQYGPPVSRRLRRAEGAPKVEASAALSSSSAARILSEPTLVIERKIELFNLFLGYEQANNYEVFNSYGQVIGYLRERDVGIVKMILRQVYKLHRPFNVDLIDLEGNVLLNINRKFSLVNSHIKVTVPEDSRDVGGRGVQQILGETVQLWHAWRRRYGLFKDTGDENYVQFGLIDAGLLAFRFPVQDEQGKIVSLIDRNWVGLGREFLTDTGVYVIRMDKQLSFEDQLYGGETLSDYELTLNDRAVLLANAVSIDFDYFSRHSGNSGLANFTDVE